MTSPAPPRHTLLVLAGRADLVFRDLHGRSLLAHALDAVADQPGPVLVAADAADRRRARAEVRRHDVDARVVVDDEWWTTTVRPDAGRGLLVADALCPLVTPAFVASVLARADAEPGTAMVSYRPVTDTLKAVDGDRILGTVDRERLATITSPLVVPGAVLSRATDGAPPPVADASALVGWLRARCDVELVRAPSTGRRVEHLRAVHLLEHLDQVAHRVRSEGGRPTGEPV